MKHKIFNTPEGFYSAIPKDVKENIRFRIELHKLLAVDKNLQKVFLELCRMYYPIFFSSTAWTINPQKMPGERNQPFILRPAQLPAVERLNWCIDNKKDAGLNKSRKQGASEICCKLFTAKALLESDSHFIVGSRTKNLVDNFGDPNTLFAKIDNVFECLPSWWLELTGYEPKKCRKDMNLIIPSTNSSFSGDTTNENFSAGSRGTAILLDEFGRVDYSLAESIEGSVHDVADCVIYSSTHWLGANHTFNKCINKETTERIDLLWYDSPEESPGLYKTSELGKIEIVDKDYYSEQDIQNAITLTDIANYNPNETKVQFIADGLKGIPSPFRAPWFDYQNYKRYGNKRDFVCNVCATPFGASETPFDHAVLEEIQKKYICPHDYVGELSFKQYSNGMINTEQVCFNIGYGKLKWWGALPFGRPDQRHNYIIAIDPSYGLGSANSAMMIYDRNISHQVGAWADANTKPEELADITVALAYWCGGIRLTYLIWDTGGACGTIFTNRLLFHRYPCLYTQRREDSKTRKQTQKWGWIGTGKRKDALLGELSVALSSGLVANRDEYKSIIIHDSELISELFDYIFRESGTGAVVSKKADLSTGALERHGDRAITAGLCVLARNEQPIGDINTAVHPPYGSFQHRFNTYKDEEDKNKQEVRTFLF